MKKLYILIVTIFITTVANAQLVLAGQHFSNGYYYNVNPDTILSSGDYFETPEYNIDINNDGIIDFIFRAYYSTALGGGMNASWLTAMNGNQIALAYYDSCFGISFPNHPATYITKFKMAKAFNFNDTINTYTKWTDTSAYLAYYNWEGNDHWCSDNTFSQSDSLYIGVRVFLDSKTWYGWIKIKDVTNTTVTVEEFAGNGVSNVISDALNNPYIIYPNPVKNNLYIETSLPVTETTLIISNIKGQELVRRQIKNSRTQLDIGNLAGGVYFVKLITDKAIEVKKIIKE